VGGLAATVARFRDRRRDLHATVLLLVTLLLFVAVFSRWHDFRTHHLLPTFPPLVLLLAAALVRFRKRSPGAANVVIALLLVSGGLYATASSRGASA
jgi:4-amino-4-deoxy-L-arabinose transferase-like glycosyltransferase